MPIPRRKRIRIALAIIILSRNYASVKVIAPWSQMGDVENVDLNWGDLTQDQQSGLDKMTDGLPTVSGKTNLEITALDVDSGLQAWGDNDVDSFEFIDTENEETPTLVEVNEDGMEGSEITSVNDAASEFS